MLYPFIKITDVVLEVYSYFIWAQIILSWLIAFNVINSHQPMLRSIIGFLYQVTEPVYRRVRRFLPNMGGVDLSALVVLLGIYFLRMLLVYTIWPMLGG